MCLAGSAQISPFWVLADSAVVGFPSLQLRGLAADAGLLEDVYTG